VSFIDFIHVPLCFCVNVCSADRDSSSIRVYDGRGSSDVLHTFDKLHSNPVVMMKVIRSSVNVCLNTCVHVDMPSQICSFKHGVTTCLENLNMSENLTSV